MPFKNGALPKMQCKQFCKLLFIHGYIQKCHKMTSLLTNDIGIKKCFYMGGSECELQNLCATFLSITKRSKSSTIFSLYSSVLTGTRVHMVHYLLFHQKSRVSNYNSWSFGGKQSTVLLISTLHSCPRFFPT